MISKTIKIENTLAGLKSWQVTRWELLGFIPLFTVKIEIK